ncbi:hypothetical protein ACFOOK_03940 [Micromonospora krabiensis]|uniref:Uncharacterized protein n=1 Tax=Micromonospora krabiensis TaxID=307121 RepID=A0A1C3NE88_9ACTN|nr:hypothetical protein [Micromonospora krabiensis]SBV30858.1 hypothetical protein GA0070620_6461 [Micromonospora krabiensis]
MISTELQLFADYYQVHLFDDGSMTDLGDAWTEDAVLDNLAVDRDAMAVGTAVNVNVAVTLEVLEAAPEDDSAVFDHVVEASLQISSGRLVLMGCTDYEPEAARFEIAPGPVRVRAARSNLADAERRGIDSDDDPTTMEQLRLQVWPAPHADPVVIKRWKPLST